MRRKLIFKNFRQFVRVCKEITRRQLNYELNQKLSNESKFVDLSDEVSYLDNVEVEYNRDGKEIGE